MTQSDPSARAPRDAALAPSHLVVAGRVLSRRHFLGAVSASVATSVATGAALPALLPAQGDAPVSAVSGVAMDPSGYKRIDRPAKPNAKPQLDKTAMENLERQIGCACPCALDVFTCRTTDFSCGISPDMHRDVLRLIEGGYSADEILDTFVGTYGEQILMAPKKEGFNLAGYWMPFAALGTGAVVLTGLIRKWGRRAAEVQAAAVQASHRTNGNGASPYTVDATPEELARLEAAVRGEGR